MLSKSAVLLCTQKILIFRYPWSGTPVIWSQAQSMRFHESVGMKYR
jgi:hypothetical protein